MKDIDEQIYIDKIKNGDSNAYSFLVNKYKNMAFSIALKILRNREEAEDAAHESFMKAYRQIHTFEEKSKFSTWLYTIVYRTAISKIQSHKLEIVSINDEIYENYATDFTAPPINQLEAKEQQQYVKEAIQKLPPMEALLVTLYYINENNIIEIQEITGLTASNIKTKLFRARKKLEQELRFLLE